MACCNCFPVVAAAVRKSMKFPDRTGTEAVVLWNLILRNEERNFPNRRQRLGNYCRWVLQPHIRLLMEQTAPDWPRSHMPDFAAAGCIQKRPAGMAERIAVVVVQKDMAAAMVGTAVAVIVVGEGMRGLMQPDTPVLFPTTGVTDSCCYC